MGRLEDRVAIVTGAGRGIGRATAVKLASEGARVVVNDIDADPTNETVDLIKQSGGEAVANVANTIELSVARELVEQAVQSYGKLDILVNNAGASRDKMFHNMDDQLFDFVLNANLRTAFHCVLAAMPHLRDVARRELDERGEVSYHRKIMMTSSIAAITGNLGQFNYSAAKGAIISVTRTLALELGRYRINVNAVAPGFIETRMTARKEPGAEMGIPEASRQAMIAAIPVGRGGRPEDVANLHAFLVSSEADFISGVTVPIAGGQIGTM